MTSESFRIQMPVCIVMLCVMCQCVELYYVSSFVIGYANGLGFRLVDCGSSVSDQFVAVTLSSFFFCYSVAVPRRFTLLFAVVVYFRNLISPEM